METILLELSVIFLLILANGFFSGSELAICAGFLLLPDPG
jgi:hypothetical protein